MSQWTPGHDPFAMRSHGYIRPKLTSAQRAKIHAGWRELREEDPAAVRWEYVKAMALEYGVSASTINGLIDY